MLCVRAGMGGVENICILMCERAGLGACRRAGVFRGSVWLRMGSGTSVSYCVLPLIRSLRCSWGRSLGEQRR